jgi:hypothetical protein
MPSFQFYAAATDRESVVAFAFDSLACRVFEAYSAYDAPLRELADVSEFVSLSTAGGVQACHLAVWSPSFGRRTAETSDRAHRRISAWTQSLVCARRLGARSPSVRSDQERRTFPFAPRIQLGSSGSHVGVDRELPPRRDCRMGLACGCIHRAEAAQLYCADRGREDWRASDSPGCK